MRIVGAIGIGVAALATFLWLKGRGQIDAAHQQLKQSDERFAVLQSENLRLSNLVAYSQTGSSTNASLSELLKLRGEVGLLRREMKSLSSAQKVAESGLRAA